MDHDLAGKLPDRQKTRDLFAVAELACRIRGIKEAEIVIEKNYVELFRFQDLDRADGRCGVAISGHTLKAFTKPEEPVLGVVEDEDADIFRNSNL